MKKHSPILILIFSTYLGTTFLLGQTIHHQILNRNEARVITCQLYDYDADGDQDIVALEEAIIEHKRVTQLVLRENDAVYQFSKRKIIEIGEIPWLANQLAVGDYNQDGLVDFLIVCKPQEYKPSELLFFYAQKTGTYQRKLLTQPFFFTKIEQQDFNKDGLMDLLVSGQRLDFTTNDLLYNNKPLELFLFSNRKDSFAIKPIDTEGKIIKDWSVGDLNRDGYPDLVYASEQSLELLFNNKNGAFFKKRSLAVAPANSEAVVNRSPISNLNILNLNHDQHPEIVWRQRTSNGDFLQFANAKNDYQINSLEVKLPPGVMFGPETHFADLNQDKRLDIINNLNGVLYFYIQQVDRIFVFQKSLRLLQNSSVSLIDIDHDNDLDVLSFYTHDIYWYEIDQDQYHCRFVSLNIEQPCAYHFIDIDRDNDQDIFLLESGANKLQRLVLFKSNGQGQFSNYVFQQKISAFQIESLDVDQNSYDDPLICTTKGELLWMRNTGKFERWVAIVIDSSLYMPKSIAVLDLNQDGKKDIIVGCHGDSKLVYFRNLGMGKFEKTYLDLNIPMPLKIQSADFNQDGYPDLAVLAKDSSLFSRIYWQESRGKLNKLADFKGTFGKDLVLKDFKTDLLYQSNGQSNLSFNMEEKEQKQFFTLLNHFSQLNKQVKYTAEERLHYVVSNPANHPSTEFLFDTSYPFQILYFRIEQQP